VKWPPVEGLRIFVAAEPVDLRKSFDGLAAVTRGILGHDPMSSHLFVFRNRQGHRCKALLWDRTGWVILYKRLENGRFRFPVADDAAVEVDAEQLRLLLDGIELSVSVRPRGGP
jgi:transposase